jgi:predicted RNase H-like nuclease (RuvC/YqgF family)
MDVRFSTSEARDALAHRLASAAADGDNERCAGVLVEQMGAATDVDDAKNRATWMLDLIRNATAERATHETAAGAARLLEENATLREHVEHGAREVARLREENASLRERTAAADRDGTVLKRGVMAQQRRYEEMERDAAAMKKKVAELEMTNYALNVRLRDADGCRFQAAYRGPDVC